MPGDHSEALGVRRSLALLARASEAWERWSVRGSVAVEMATTHAVRWARTVEVSTSRKVAPGGPRTRGNAHLPGVLFVVPWLRVGGADKAVIDLVRHLNGSAIDATVLATLGMRNGWAGGLRAAGVPVVVPQDLPPGSRARRAAMDALMEDRSIRLVQVSQSRAGYGMLEHLRRVHGVRTVSLVQLPDPRAMERDFVALSAHHRASIDRHVAVAPHVAEALVCRGVREEDIECIPNGVDTELFRPADPDAGIEPDGLLAGLPADQPVVAFVGRLVEQKDPITFVQMVSRLRHRLGSGFSVVVVGGGPLRRLTEVMLRATGHPGLTRCTGPASESEVASVLPKASVVVAPSRYEGLPLVGLEAMACGVPVVASDVDGWRDLVAEGRTGFLCTPGDPDAFAERTATLLGDPGLRERMGTEARRVAEERFALGLVLAQYRRLYADLLA